MSNPSKSQGFHWQEAENYSFVSVDQKRAISRKVPASGGKSTSGAIFIEAGNKIQYDFTLTAGIPKAKLVLRYARLHFRENMPPAQFMLTLSTGGTALHKSFECGNTNGWGALKASEWDYVEIYLNTNLQPEPIEIWITAMEDGSNVNFDGFYIVPAGFELTQEETIDLERIQFSSHGYRGLRIAGDTVFPGVFDGFEIVGRSFCPLKSMVSAYLTNDKDVRISIMDTAPLCAADHPGSHLVSAVALNAVPDGFYELCISFDDEAEPLRYPLTILRDLVVQSKIEAKAFRELAVQFEQGGRTKEHAFIPDLEHAAEYLENTVLLLEARQKGKATTSKRAAALAYFERSKARTARDFAEDMDSIISQTKASLSKIASNSNPYAERYGDFRRAFKSKATGILEPYRIFVPEAYGTLESIPLLLMLHGGGGDENYHLDLENGIVKEILSERPYVMLSPRCTSWYEGPGLDDLVQLIQETLQQYPKLDPSRVYSTGVSRGGGGSFQLALHAPDLLAGIACVSSAPNITNKIDSIRDLPMLFINGGIDVVVDPERARKMSTELDKRGIPHRLVIYPDAGHEYDTREYLNLSLDFFEKK